MRLHIQQVSGEFTATRQQAREAYARAFDRGAHFIGGTEAGHAPLSRVLHAQAARANYELFAVKGGGWVAVAPGIRVVDHVNTVLIPPLNAPASAGGHGPRGVLSVTGDLGECGLHSFSEQHWLTGFRLGHNAGDNTRREGFHAEQSHGIVDAVRHGGRGHRTATWAGDVNIDEPKDTGHDPDAPAAIFRAGGLVSIFDDLDRYPDTHGPHTLDVIGRLVTDDRLRPERVVVHTSSRGLFDHLALSAFYDLAPRKGGDTA